MIDSSRKFDEHLAAVAYRNGRGAALFLAGFTAALWPTDLVIFRGVPDVQSVVNWLRVSVISLSLLIYALMRTRLGPRYPTQILGIGGSLLLFAIGWGFGEIGGPDRPWIHLAYSALFFSVLAPIRVTGRTLLVCSLTVALCLGFLAPHPQYWSHPLTTMMLSFIASLAAIVIAVGHLSFRILRQSFFQSLELENASSQLAGLNDTLETRVQAQTRDLRRLTDHLERAREEERKRIARELHDQLGQELTALNLTLALTQQRFTRDPNCIKGNLADMEALVARTRATARNLVTELRPQLLDDLGLQAGLEWLVRQTEEHAAPLKCNLMADALGEVDPDSSTVAFRIVQEALTNVVRHAKAKGVDIALAVRDGELNIAVSDDGIGLPMEPPASSGFGLIGIRERVATRSGTMQLSPRPGGGTTLMVTIPLATTTEEVRQ
ncbi:MAG: Sensory box histidine kinase [Myxococcales bacterium]|nr:Sensory box histidine kinase [Myxococcales bacterium]